MVCNIATNGSRWMWIEGSKNEVRFLPAVGGGVWGALIGHVLIPVPFVGRIVCGVVCGFIGIRSGTWLSTRGRSQTNYDKHNIGYTAQ